MISRNIICFLIAHLICHFLFYIDEGYYNFRWMNSVGNWVVFIVYNSITFSIVICIDKIILANNITKSNIFYTLLLSVVFTVLFVWYLAVR